MFGFGIYFNEWVIEIIFLYFIYKKFFIKVFLIYLRWILIFNIKRQHVRNDIIKTGNFI